MGSLRWWQFGVFGGCVLSFATLVKVIGAIPRFFTEAVPWSELTYFPLAVFGMGFVCGVVVWAARFLSRWFGLAGDAMVGAIVMFVFFLLCMLVFDREILMGNRRGALVMLAAGSAIGLAMGLWIGSDLRRESRQRVENEPESNSGA
jgi:hypothetical protein